MTTNFENDYFDIYFKIETYLDYLKEESRQINSFEIEDFVVDRIQLYRIFEKSITKDYAKYSKESREFIIQNLQKSKLKTYRQLCDRDLEFFNSSELTKSVGSIKEALREDRISHYALRLACCNMYSTQEWFIDKELQWLDLRYYVLPPEGQDAFLENYRICFFETVDDDEKNLLSSELVKSIDSIFNRNIDEVLIYKIPFKKAINLISQRSVYVSNGYAYITNDEIISCILLAFRTSLRDTFSRAKSLSLLTDSEIFMINRIQNLLNKENSYQLCVQHNKDYCPDIKLSKMDAYCEQHFPLCMKHIYRQLKSEHHLKYGGRLQLTTFLKSIGLTLEHSLDFWKESFSKIDEKVFERKYAYYIKHAYGRVGGMKEYFPQTCQSIICEKVGPLECHGCPFKVWDEFTLKNKLIEEGLSTEYVSAIIDKTQTGQYETACSMHLNRTAPKDEIDAVQQPSQYFKESFLRAKANECKVDGDTQDSDDTDVEELFSDFIKNLK